MDSNEAVRHPAGSPVAWPPSRPVRRGGRGGPVPGRIRRAGGACRGPPASGCAAVNLIVARASTEAPGEGITQSLATQIVNSSAQTVSQEAVVYPATLTNYTSSESQGVTNAEQE